MPPNRCGTSGHQTPCGDRPGARQHAVANAAWSNDGHARREWALNGDPIPGRAPTTTRRHPGDSMRRSSTRLTQRAVQFVVTACAALAAPTMTYAGEQAAGYFDGKTVKIVVPQP